MLGCEINAGEISIRLFQVSISQKVEPLKKTENGGIEADFVCLFVCFLARHVISAR